MRIALVHMRHAALGGTELVLDQLSRRLAERGHDVTIVCRSHVEPAHAAIRFEVLRGPALGGAWRMLAFAAGVERHVARTHYDLVFGLGKTWSHDVIRTSGGSHATYIEQMRLAQHGGRGSWPRWKSLKDRCALAIERRAYAPGAYRRVIANSRLVRDDICRRYAVPDQHIDVVHNGVDLQRFRLEHRTRAAAWRATLALDERAVVFLFFGSGYARKGLERMLRAFQLVAAQRPESRLVIAGGDGKRAHYERLARALGLASLVRFLGVRRDAELCFAASDVYVLPTWYDSFALTVLESLASGTPVITTAGAGAAELIAPGVNGDVIASDCTPADLSRALLEWGVRERVEAARAPARALAEDYGFDATIGRMIAVLERVAEAPR
jgi:UDP-glucose:(heptosyl)LPS alpha-1,3-glucosyltransferase